MTRLELKITAKAHRTILRWAQSQREIGFICAGQKEVITHVFRIKNIDYQARIAFVPMRSQLIAIRSTVKKNGMAVLCEGHSHPHPKDTAKPSHGDCEFIKPNMLELIVCPVKGEVRCWRMSRSRKKTLKQEIPVVVVSKVK